MTLPAFVEALEQCITEISATVSRTAIVWADHCESPGDKTWFQAGAYVETAALGVPQLTTPGARLRV